MLPLDSCSSERLAGSFGLSLRRKQSGGVRLEMRRLMETWFPQAMAPVPSVHGLFPLREVDGAELTVVLVHGLDEPGGIWDDLVPALEDKSVNLWELRYPNDQAIDRSGQFFAEQWDDLPSELPTVLIGHSMGGLVIREFVSAWRHPVGVEPRVRGARVQAAYLVGTPNHGSEWARLRCWMELRDHFPDKGSSDFSLFAALRDGFGVAKIDLRPGSGFLTTLNTRAWPEAVDLRMIAGVVMDDARMQASLKALLERAPDESSQEALQRWWEGVSSHLGDGVVTVESVTLEGFAEPVMCVASHRGLIKHTVFESGAPPAVPVLEEWIDALLSR